ncbi:hypothetical protein EJ06DRAFT_231980 [Trichodelitschia bisporula]|uniref:Uncharacterized protein n=1 Tax=Trichodelitschia bisporula TaxID=703511 RepID=A0A6G1HJM8_9PEZI|nr:hypothetical protein EJ06DRAFT_231980 [Trichodelitschia bisporula]
MNQVREPLALSCCGITQCGGAWRSQPRVLRGGCDKCAKAFSVCPGRPVTAAAGPGTGGRSLTTDSLSRGTRCPQNPEGGPVGTRRARSGGRAVASQAKMSANVEHHVTLKTEVDSSSWRLDVKTE